jgi:hypothetical protein
MSSRLSDFDSLHVDSSPKRQPLVALMNLTDIHKRRGNGPCPAQHTAIHERGWLFAEHIDHLTMLSFWVRSWWMSPQVPLLETMRDKADTPARLPL